MKKSIYVFYALFLLLSCSDESKVGTGQQEKGIRFSYTCELGLTNYTRATSVNDVQEYYASTGNNEIVDGNFLSVSSSRSKVFAEVGQNTGNALQFGLKVVFRKDGIPFEVSNFKWIVRANTNILALNNSDEPISEITFNGTLIKNDIYIKPNSAGKVKISIAGVYDGQSYDLGSFEIDVRNVYEPKVHTDELVYSPQNKQTTIQSTGNTFSLLNKIGVYPKKINDQNTYYNSERNDADFWTAGGKTDNEPKDVYNLSNAARRSNSNYILAVNAISPAMLLEFDGDNRINNLIITRNDLISLVPVKIYSARCKKVTEYATDPVVPILVSLNADGALKCYHSNGVSSCPLDKDAYWCSISYAELAEKAQMAVPVLWGFTINKRYREYDSWKQTFNYGVISKNMSVTYGFNPNRDVIANHEYSHILGANHSKNNSVLNLLNEDLDNANSYITPEAWNEIHLFNNDPTVSK